MRKLSNARNFSSCYPADDTEGERRREGGRAHARERKNSSEHEKENASGSSAKIPLLFSFLLVTRFFTCKLQQYFYSRRSRRKNEEGRWC